MQKSNLAAAAVGSAETVGRCSSKVQHQSKSVPRNASRKSACSFSVTVLSMCTWCVRQLKMWRMPGEPAPSNDAALPPPPSRAPSSAGASDAGSAQGDAAPSAAGCAGSLASTFTWPRLLYGGRTCRTSRRRVEIVPNCLAALPLGCPFTQPMHVEVGLCLGVRLPPKRHGPLLPFVQL